MALRPRFPDCAIDVVGPSWCVPLLARMPLGHHDCLRGIRPESVLAAVHRAHDEETARGSRGSHATP